MLISGAGKFSCSLFDSDDDDDGSWSVVVALFFIFCHETLSGIGVVLFGVVWCGPRRPLSIVRFLFFNAVFFLAKALRLCSSICMLLFGHAFARLCHLSSEICTFRCNMRLFTFYFSRVFFFLFVV